MTESNGSILIYGSITYLVETNSTNELGLITPEKEISFNLPNNLYEIQNDLELTRVKDEEKINITNKKIQNFGILLTKTDRRIGQKLTEMPYQLIDIFHINALQNLDEYNSLNLININSIPIR